MDGLHVRHAGRFMVPMPRTRWEYKTADTQPNLDSADWVPYHGQGVELRGRWVKVRQTVSDPLAPWVQVHQPTCRIMAQFPHNIDFGSYAGYFSSVKNMSITIPGSTASAAFPLLTDRVTATSPWPHDFVVIPVSNTVGHVVGVSGKQTGRCPRSRCGITT